MPKKLKQSRNQLVLESALQLLSSARYSDAVQILMPLVKVKPNDFNGLLLLGSALVGLHQNKEALIFLLRAEQINSKNTSLLNSIATAYNELNDTISEVNYLQKSIALNPKNEKTYYKLGKACANIKAWSDAIQNFSIAIELKNDYITAYRNLARCLIQINAYDETIKLCDLFMEQLGLDYGMITYRCQALFNKGLKTNAIRELHQYIQRKPDWHQLYTVLAEFYSLTNQYDSANEFLVKSIQLNPKEFRNYNNLGNLQMKMGKPELAAKSYLKSIEMNESFSIAHQNLGGLYNTTKDYETALIYLRKAKELDPNAPLINGLIIQAQIYSCDWSEIENLSKEIGAAIPQRNDVCNPFYPIAFIEDQRLLTKLARDWGTQKFPASHFLGQIKQKERGSRIKLGYFSADFHTHATALLMAGFFENHNKSRFEVIAFSFGPDQDSPLTRRLRVAFDQFIDVRKLSDRAVAAYARDLGVDIAIDLKGFTNQARPSIFAERAAPIQINYLGFPGSMGSPYIDYILADSYIIPPGQEHLYSEKVIRLPHCYQPNDNLRRIADIVQSRQDHNLPENALVLCCFNNNYKITPPVFHIWMRVLNQFPNAVLWLLKDTPEAEKNLLIEAQSRGVHANRLVFAPRIDSELHLARHSIADLFLDTYPCNAHTTASDSLWSGLPLVTCSGNSFASRVAGSLLTTLGLPELITHNLVDYEKTIVALMSNSDALAALKVKTQQLRKNSPLFDTYRFTKDFEELMLELLESPENAQAKKPRT